MWTKWGGGGQIQNWEFCLGRKITLTAEHLPEPEGNRDKFKQLETEQSSIQSDQQTIGSNQTGFVCRETECSSERLCQLEDRSNGGGNRCIHDKMDGQASLCLPSILSNTEMSSQSSERRGELIIVTPSWQTQAFYPVLLNMTVRDRILSPPLPRQFAIYIMSKKKKESQFLYFVF